MITPTVKLSKKSIKILADNGFENSEEVSNYINTLIESFNFEDKITPEQEEYYAQVEKEIEEGTLDMSDAMACDELKKEILGD